MNEVVEQQPGMQVEERKGAHIHALLLRLRPQTAGTLPSHIGQIIHAAILHWIEEVNPEYSAILHEPNKKRPFTCSSLWLANAQRPIMPQDKNACIAIYPQQIYWLRLTLLTEHLFHTFMHRFFQETTPTLNGSSFPTLKLSNILFEIVDVASEATIQKQEPQALYWGGHTTYSKLVEETRRLDLQQAKNRHITLEFCTPTFFSNGQRAGGRHMCLFPETERVFDSLARTWNYWAPDHFVLNLQELQTYITNWVTVSSHELSTKKVYFDHTIQNGFVGKCTYTFLGRPPFGMKDQTEPLAPVQTLHLLSHYAFYTGIGSKTTMGMGQVRPLIER